MIEDFLAKYNSRRCQSFKDVAEVISKVGFRMFLGVSPTIANWSSDDKEFSLVMDENPLADMVELPEECSSLYYSNILCGVMRGALESVSILIFQNLFIFIFYFYFYFYHHNQQSIINNNIKGPISS